MIGREKIIYDLERCTCNEPNACRDCSHNVKLGFGCTEYLLKDALDLLKEQEAIIEQYHRADGFLAAHGWKWEVSVKWE